MSAIELVWCSCCLWLPMLMPLEGLACGPSPQKVSHEVKIAATPEAVWSILNAFDAMHYWHPMVVSTQMDAQQTALGVHTEVRHLQLKQGGWIKQTRRWVSDDGTTGVSKLAYTILDTSLPLSNYSDQLTVKYLPKERQTLVAWTGRFTNQANAMVASPGLDNATAIGAVNDFYRAGLAGLKQLVESKR